VTLRPLWTAWRGRIGLASALATVAAALLMPSPRPAAPPPSSAPAGPLRLAQVWPGVRPTVLPSTLRDSYSYQPMLVLDPTTSVGLGTSPDLSRMRLVICSDGGERDLRDVPNDQSMTFAGLAVSGQDLFWLETGTDAAGARHTSLWRAGLGSGPARRLSVGTSDVLYYDSAYDLAVVDGVAYWAATANGGGGELHSAPVTGGPERVRRLDRLYALTAWPWATTSGNGQPGPVSLLNLVTGERRVVPASSAEILTCTPTWCRVTTLINGGKSLIVEIERLDGGSRRKTGDTALTPLNTDVAVLDRFEVLASAASANASGSAQRLWLYEMATGRTILLADAASDGLGARDGYLWWPTGDNEATVWHVLDLRRLT
jgi:hypothetical protein